MERARLQIVFFLLAGMTLFEGCNDRKPSIDSDYIVSDKVEFPKEILLEGEGVKVDDILLRYPYRIRQNGKYLYLIDLHAEMDFCHVIDTVSWQEVITFAPRGSGPDETLQAMNLQVISPEEIWIYDTDKREVNRWSFDEKNDTAILQERIRMKETMLTSANCVMCGDTAFLFTDRTGTSRIVRCNRRGELSGRIGYIPATLSVDENAKAALAQAWHSFIDYNPQNEILAIVTQLGDVMEVYNLKNGTKHVLYGPYGEPQYRTTRDGYAVPVGIMGYSDVQVTDNYIYAVFHGRTFKEIAKDPLNTPDGGEYIHIFTHDGTPVCRLVLDHAIYGIHVNEEEGIIWATDVNTEEQIVKYQLPIFLKQ